MKPHYRHSISVNLTCQLSSVLKINFKLRCFKSDVNSLFSTRNYNEYLSSNCFFERGLKIFSTFLAILQNDIPEHFLNQALSYGLSCLSDEQQRKYEKNRLNYRLEHLVLLLLQLATVSYRYIAQMGNSFVSNFVDFCHSHYRLKY